ncbi:MAG TPA: sarcosine oxidase subunit gamma family protein [Alphaproteobacteria bacterium]|nr:sarcosine oxidase subunit gamma family protein [Alphaproteobacteria bacterium]
MTERYLRQGALAQLTLAKRATIEPGTAGVHLCDHGFLGQLGLRGSGDPAFCAAVESVLGTAPPLEPNRVAEGREARILWLGPDEWLAVLSEERTEAAAKTLLERLAGEHVAVVDLSEARAAIGLAGPRARDVLAQGCSLDIHPRVFLHNHCAQTLLAQVPVIIHRRGGGIAAGSAYDIYVQRSLAEYLWHWLEDAAQGYGIAILEG